MITFKTTDLNKKKLIKKEDFLDKSFRIVTRSGLHYLESNLITFFDQIKDFKGKILFIENRTGVAPMIFKSMHPDAHVTIQNYDIHHTNTAIRTLRQNDMLNNINTETCAYLPKVKFDLIVLQIPKDMAKELVQDTIQQIYQQLKKDCRLIVAYENRMTTMKGYLKDYFAGSTTATQNKHATIEIAKKKSESIKIKNFQSEFILPNKQLTEINLISIPGVFSHRRVDQGALAMTETIQLSDNQKILDLGCGCGSIGITLALNAKNIEATFVDSNARAIEATTINCQNKGLKNCQFILSDKGYQKENHYDVVVGNPPYFSDYKIAEMFLSNAYENLKIGGKVFMVTKTVEWFEINMDNIFGNTEITQRRGYSIISSIKNN